LKRKRISQCQWPAAAARLKCYIQQSTGTEMSIDTQKIFTQLLNEHRGIVFKIAKTYTQNEDDRADLTQEIIYNIWKSFEKYNKEYKFSTWMYRIALNVAISFYRQKTRSPFYESISEDMQVFDEGSSDKLAEEKNLQLLFDFIGKLNPIDKAIILLYLDSTPHAEIAVIMGFSVGNIATRINRIKEKLRNNFSQF
jgi:RNA polymerase sigma factor (sigma-70 family)